MAPHSTFLRRPGFLGSFRLLILLRTRLRYFMSVLFSSWKICGVCQGIKGARWGDASLGGAVTRANGHMEVADLSGAFLHVGSVPILGFRRMKHSLRCGEENDFAFPWNV